MSINYVTPIVIVAVLSCFSSFLVIFTFIFFRDLRNKPFMKLITYISAADLLGNLSYIIVIAQPPQNSPACFLQAYLASVLYPSSWLWTSTLSYFLFYLATTARTPREYLRFRIISWGLPVFLFLLSVPFATFQQPEDFSFEVCAAAGVGATIYHNATVYSLFVLSLGTMTFLHIKIRELEFNRTENVRAPTFIAAKAVLTYYPLSMVICWIPHMVVSFLFEYGRDRWCGERCDNLYYLTDLLKILHGAVAALIFFSKSREARRLWYKLLFGENPTTLNIDSYDISYISEEGMSADLASMDSRGRGSLVDPLLLVAKTSEYITDN